MADRQKGMTVNAMLAVAVIIGILVLGALWLIAGYGFFGAFLLGLIAGVIALLVLYYGFGMMHPEATPDGSAGHVAASAPSGIAPPAASGAAASADKDKAAPVDSTGATAGLDARSGAQGTPKTGAAPPASAKQAGTREEVAKDVSKGMAAGPSETAAAAASATQAATSGHKDAPADTGDAEGGTKPAPMAAPRDGGPDNLKEIKGVGPKLETLLHDLGIYHFDQIAGWGAAEVAWMDGNLKGFRGRVSRDDWVEQARLLAAGGETEFSKKVGKGGVY